MNCFFALLGTYPKMRHFCPMNILNKENERHAKCLWCGEELVGRPEKKFCSLACKNAWNNNRNSDNRLMRNRIMTAIMVNYRILERVLNANNSSIELRTAEDLGFRPSYITGYRRTYGRHDELSCFDIRYYQTATRLFNIRRI